MDDFYAAELPLVSVIQSRWNYPSLWNFVNHASDPRNAFLVLFPFIYFVNTALALQIFWASTLASHINILLKWMLDEARPFWWVSEAGLAQLTPIKQYYNTCETGPGSPSGHCMVSAACWFVICANIGAKNHPSSSNEPIGQPHKVTRSTITVPPNLEDVSNQSNHPIKWCVLVLLICLVMISRCFIATHFPHQVLLGSVVGLILGYLLRSLSIDKVSAFSYFLAAFSVMSSSLIVFYGLPRVGIDTMRTQHLASRWCHRKAWIHLDTTPLYTVFQCFSCLIAFGLRVHFYGNENISLRIQQNRLLQSAAIFISLWFGRTADAIKLPFEPLWLFYVLTVLKWALFTIFTCLILPKLILRHTPLVTEKSPTSSARRRLGPPGTGMYSRLSQD